MVDGSAWCSIAMSVASLVLSCMALREAMATEKAVEKMEEELRREEELYRQGGAKWMTE